jgi:hypothetical protein
MSISNWIPAIAIALSTLIMLPHQAAEVRKMHEMPVEPVKTVCVGRFLLDVPEVASVSYGRTRIAGWDVQTDVHESEAQFTARLQNTENELATAKNERGGVSLELSIPIQTANLTGKIFVYGRQWIKGISGGKAVYSETASIRGIGRSKGVSFDFLRDIGKARHIEELERLMQQLRERAPESVPSGSGFCFDHGLVIDPLNASQAEFTVAFIGLPKHPDLAIALSSAAGRTPGKSLLQRDAENNEVKKEYSSHFHILRQGNRSLQDMPGEELLERVTELNGGTVHNFIWELQGQQNDVNSPTLSLELNTGRGLQGPLQHSSLSDQEVLKLWQEISESLRRRPADDESSR